MMKAAPPADAVMKLTIFALILTVVAIYVSYLPCRLFRKNRKLGKELQRYHRQMESLLLENRKLTAPNLPPRKTPEQWEAQREVEQVQRQTKQLRDVQLEDVTFVTQKVMAGGELDMFYAGHDLTGQARPSNPYPFYVFPQVSLGEIIRTSSPRDWRAKGAYRAINSKRCDLLVANVWSDPIAAFEYQGGGHYIGSDTEMRDRIKHIALQRAGIRVVEIKNGTSRSQIGQIMRDLFEQMRTQAHSAGR